MTHLFLALFLAVAQTDRTTTRIQDAIDTLVDVAQKEAAAKPQPTVSAETVRKVVNFRTAARQVIKDHGNTCADMCKAEVGVSLFKLQYDPGLAAIETQILQPYFALVRAALDARF